MTPKGDSYFQGSVKQGRRLGQLFYHPPSSFWSTLVTFVFAIIIHFILCKEFWGRKKLANSYPNMLRSCSCFPPPFFCKTPPPPLPHRRQMGPPWPQRCDIFQYFYLVFVNNFCRKQENRANYYPDTICSSACFFSSLVRTPPPNQRQMPTLKANGALPGPRGVPPAPHAWSRRLPPQVHRSCSPLYVSVCFHLWQKKIIYLLWRKIFFLKKYNFKIL